MTLGLNGQMSMNEGNLNRVIADQKAGSFTLTLMMLGIPDSQVTQFFTAVFGKWNASPSRSTQFVVLIVVLAIRACHWPNMGNVKTEVHNVLVYR
jgi:hypothetical protein